jgi:hypothetical protein
MPIINLHNLLKVLLVGYDQYNDISINERLLYSSGDHQNCFTVGILPLIRHVETTLNLTTHQVFLADRRRQTIIWVSESFSGFQNIISLVFELLIH